MQVCLSNILSILPSNIFEEASAEFKVDRYNHKLTGKSLFQILLYNICEENRISLRVIEESFQKHQFRIFHKNKPLKASKSGISDRLKTIDYRYYEKIFMQLQKSLSKETPRDYKKHIKIFDSTIITLSSKLLKNGFKVPRGDKNQIKFSIGFDGLPCKVRFGTTSSDMSENIALRDTIKSFSFLKSDIAVFDRGISSRKTFKEFNGLGIQFVTRMNDNVNFRVVKENNFEKYRETETVTIVADSVIQLRSKKVHWVKENFRLVQAVSKKTGNPLNFLTNIDDLSAADITEIYRERWNIEVFFKFIKQYLNTKHFLSRSINGIKVVFFMILIASLLILTFKNANKIPSFKIAKKRFVEQLSRAVTYDIIILYKNDPEIFKQKFAF